MATVTMSCGRQFRSEVMAKTTETLGFVPREIDSTFQEIGEQMDPLRDSGHANLLDLIPHGFIPMPFLLNTTTTNKFSMTKRISSGASRGPAAPRTHIAADRRTAIAKRAPSTQRYRFGQSLKDRPRRRHLFQDNVEDEPTLSEKLNPTCPADSTEDCGQTNSFMLDSSRLPQYSDTYVDVTRRLRETGVCGEKLLDLCVNGLARRRPDISRCVWRALEKRLLPDYGDDIAELMHLFVVKATLQDEVNVSKEIYRHQQDKLALARSFIDATIEKLLPEDEQDVVKVLGFNPYDGQMPPPETIRVAVMRKLQQRETANKSLSKN